MINRAFGFASLLAVIGISIVFGMLIGGRLNAPQIMLAAPQAPLQLAPATSGPAPAGGFADMIEQAMPAVVSVTSTHLGNAAGDNDEEQRGDSPSPRPDEQFWRFFFGPDVPDPHREQTPPHIGEGSGFIIAPDGYVLTNFHVVEDADKLTVALADGTRYEATVVGKDPSIDLALLKIDPQGQSLPTLSLGDSDALRVGDWVVAIGNPLEFEQTVTVGVVSAKRRRVPVGNTDTGVVHFLQTDAAINFGNSGGPLLDARGNVVGINTAIRRANYAEGIGFALPINHARQVIEQLRERGYVRRGYIGITMNQAGIDDVVAEYYGLPDHFGVVIDEVADNGPAERAGVKPGDVVRRVDDAVVRDNLDLIQKISSHQPGDRVSLEVFRKGKTLKLEATLVDREEELESLRASAGQAPHGNVEEQDDEEAEALGMTVQALTPNMKRDLQLDRDVSGVIITDVKFGSEAAEKNIVPRMIVRTINDRPIANLEDFRRAMNGLHSGAPVRITLLAGGRAVAVFLRAP